MAEAEAESDGHRLSRRTLLKGSVAGAAAAVGATLVSGSVLGVGDGVAGASGWSSRQWGYLRTPDGAADLRYSVLFPPGPGPFPVVIQYSGYDSGTIGGSAYQAGDTWLSEDVDLSLVQAGYAVMGLSMRGTGCSSGTFDLFGHGWGTDGAMAVEWAAAQPWSTGRVGMYDWSYAGLSQLCVASQRPKGLAAIAPGMVVTDPLRDVGAPGGVFNALFPALWWTTILDSWTYNGQNALSDGDTVGLANLAENYVLGQATSPPVSFTHPFEDSYWASRQQRSQCAAINVPVLSMEAWQDEEVGPRGGYYQELLNPDTTWYVGTNGQHDTYMNLRFRSQLIAFFNHFLKGESNGFENTARVQLWMETAAAGAPMASDGELEQAQPAWVIRFPTLPVPVEPVSLFFGPGGTLSTQKPAVGAASVDFVAAPGPIVNDGLVGAVTGGPGGALSEQTWDLSEQVPGTFAAFTTGPFHQTVTLSGSAAMNLWISSTLPVAEVQVTLSEVRPDGYELYLQRGWLSLEQRTLDLSMSTPLRPVHLQTLGSVRPLLPGVPVAASVEINKFTHTFRPGCALRVTLDGPSNTGDWAFAATGGGLHSVSCGSENPCALVVGLLSTYPINVPLPAPNTLIGQPCRTNRAAIPDIANEWPVLV
jgi:putative CocE/NonD family hydrolase